MKHKQVYLEEAYIDVIKEVIAQLKKWNVQRHTFEEWKTIINEEFAELQTEVIVAHKDGYDELKQVVAVGMSWMIDILMIRKEK